MINNHETRKKRLRYRTSHTGTRETDILLGGFVDRYVNSFNTKQIQDLEDLLNGANDPDILDYITARQPLPRNFNNDTISLLLRYVRER